MFSVGLVGELKCTYCIQFIKTPGRQRPGTEMYAMF